MSDANKIILRVRGLGAVPSFKNSKMLTRGRIITKPEIQTWMKRCIQSLGYQLHYLSPTGDVVMRQGPWIHSSTAWSAQFDDSIDWIPEIYIHVQRVPKGEEGAIVSLEQL